MIPKGDSFMYRSPDGWQQYHEVWSVKTIYNKYNRGEVYFDWNKQRGYVWDDVKASLFIHSIFWGMLENTETFRFSKHDTEYLCTDGQQRGLSIVRFIDGEYALKGLKHSYNIRLRDGSIFAINGKKFKQLPQELQEIIWDMQINIAILENASPDVEAEMFARMNNGIAVSKTDIAISKNADGEKFEQLGQHELFKAMLNKKQFKAKKYRGVIVRTYIAVSEESPNYRSGNVRKYEEELKFTEEIITEITNLYDTLLDVYKKLIMIENNIGKKMFSESLLYYYIPFVDVFNDDTNKMAEWINMFYKNMPENYRLIDGFSHDAVNVQRKMSIIKQSIEEFLK